MNLGSEAYSIECIMNPLYLVPRREFCAETYGRKVRSGGKTPNPNDPRSPEAEI